MTISGIGDPPGGGESAKGDKLPVGEAVNEDLNSEPEEQPQRELTLEEQLQLLLVDHRELDEHIADLQKYPYVDQLEIQRLKKKKLHLKDAITYLKDQIIPDWNA